MPLVVPVKFTYASRDLWFDPQDLDILEADYAICSTERGTEIGLVTADPFEVPQDEIGQPLKPVLRVASDIDLQLADDLAIQGDEAMVDFRRLVKELDLEMKPVGVEYLFGGEKAVFYFAAEERVDFRQLVKDLSSTLHIRVDMRQIGVRDETRLVGGYAQCGQELCCTRFGGQFEPVSIRMAKEQDLPLNSSKISGVCGRLMCCLRYEQAAYEDLVKAVPKVGAFVETPAGYGTVSSVNILRSSLKVKLDGQGEDVFKSYQADEIAVIPGGRPKPGEPLPSLLKDRPKPVRDEEPKEDPWALPQLFADDVYGDKKPDGVSAEQGEKKKRPRRRSRGHGGKKPADAQTAPRAEHAAKEGAKDGTKEGAKPKQPQRQKSQSNRKPGARKPGDKPAGEHPERSRAQAPAAKPADGAAQSGEKRADNHRRRHRGGRGRNKSAAPGNAKPGNTAPDTPKAE